MFYQSRSKNYLITLFVFGLIEILLCGGIVFGWASIVIVFKAKQFYFDKCIETPEKNFNNSFDNLFDTKDHANQIFDCLLQNDQLNLVFTVATSFLNVAQFPVGLFIDKFGPKTTRILGGTVYVIGCLGLGLISKGYEDFLFPSFTAIGIGGIVLAISVFQISNIAFWQMKALAMCSLNGAFDSSAVVLLFFKLLHDYRLELRTIMFFYSGIVFVLINLGTIFLVPPHHLLKEWANVNEHEVADDTALKEIIPKDAEVRSSPIFERVSDAQTKLMEDEEVYHAEMQVTSNETNAEDKNLSLETQASVYNSVFTSLYLLELVCLLVIHLKILCYVGSLQGALEKLMPSNLNQVSKYINIYGYVQFSGIIITPFIGLAFGRSEKQNIQKFTKEEWHAKELRSSIIPFAINNVLITVLCLFDVINSIHLQIPSYLICTAARGFLYANHATYIGIAFPSSQFGTLFGLSMLCAGIFGFLQHGIFYLTNHTFDGNSLWPNIFLLTLVVVGYAHPVNVWKLSRR